MQRSATTTTPAIPPVALGTNGHLPAIVAQATREHADQLATDGAREQTDWPLTRAQSTLTYDDDFGGWSTAPVETDQRDIDSAYPADENSGLPFLETKVVVSEYRPQAYGRTTEVYLDYGRATGALSPAEARKVLEAMRAFLPQFEAVIALAEQSAAGDFEGDPQVARLDEEYQARRFRAIAEARG